MSIIRRVCSVENCDRKHKGLGYCALHYRRYHLYKDTNIVTKPNLKHGLSSNPICSSWHHIKGRCFNPKVPEYAQYGALDITICQRWRNSLSEFYADLGDRPTPDHSIDRIDGSGNYSCGQCTECVANNWPMNCRWADREVQNWNKGIRINNKTGYIGVWHDRSKYRAEISAPMEERKMSFYLGRYDTAEEAAIAYDIACIFFRGEYAVTNFL